MRMRLGDGATGRLGAALLNGVLVVVLGLALVPNRASAQVPDSAVTARTKQLASQLRCPVCQGLSLQESQSELSQQMKGVITEQIESGKTDDQVLDYFVAKYGEWILLQPRAHGFNLAVYVLPFLVLIGGIAVLYFSVKRWTAPPDHVPHST
jgi:cytochrome c-type biogenesis protein CcmH